ncbi:hypothetical protein GGP91_003183 [Salinibacter ruber]|nr:hypothetical protein [Salinibacter ruber]
MPPGIRRASGLLSPALRLPALRLPALCRPRFGRGDFRLRSRYQAGLDRRKACPAERSPVQKALAAKSSRCKKLSLQKALAAERFWREKLPMPKRESQALSGNCRFRYSPMKALPGRPVGASLLGASPLGASPLGASPRGCRLSRLSPRSCRFEDVALKLSLRCGWPSSPCRVAPCRVAVHLRSIRRPAGRSGSIPAVAFRR